jgi:energy-coupling factor transport system ATP-binding protein
VKSSTNHPRFTSSAGHPLAAVPGDERNKPERALSADNIIEAPRDSRQQQPAVEIRNVVFTYDGTAAPALRGIDLTLKPGEMVGVMGASGAGKSTLAKCLNRLVPAFERGEFNGTVRVQGRALDGARVSDVSPLVGMVFQDFEAQLLSTNVALEVAFTMQQIGMPREEIAARIEPALAAVGLNGFAHRDPTSLSGGEKQRLAIASVLALRPGVIVLDEPTTDLDPEGKAEVFALIRQLREQGLSLIVIEHEAEELRGCDRLLLLREGRVVAQGPPASVMTQLELLETCGVHPPDLNRALALLGIRAHAADIDEAEAMIRQALSISAGSTERFRPTIPIEQAEIVDGAVSHPRGARILIPPPDQETLGGAEQSRARQAEPSGAGEPTPMAKPAGALVSRSPERSRGGRGETSLPNGPQVPVKDAHDSKESATGGSEVARGSNAPPLAEAERLYFSYPLGPRVLDAINFRIYPGEFVAIVGQNGSGKTTLAKHLVGLLTPTEGRVLLEGRDRRSLTPADTAHKAGYVFQNPDHQIFASAVAAEVAFGPRNFGLSEEEIEQRVSEVLHAVNLDDAREHDPFLLSKGERQRLAVASVLALRPRLLILDEPTTGLDYREQRRMMGLVSELNRTGIAIMIITHAPWLVAEYARRVVLMRRGGILFDGPVEKFFQHDELLGQSSFRPPEVTVLARRFGLVALSPDEFAAGIRALGDKS